MRAITTVTSMPEPAAQAALGEPLERSAHFRTPHSTHACALTHRCCSCPAERGGATDVSESLVIVERVA